MVKRSSLVDRDDLSVGENQVRSGLLRLHSYCPQR
jgi:hypothetical protein